MYLEACDKNIKCLLLLFVLLIKMFVPFICFWVTVFETSQFHICSCYLC